MIGVGFVLLWAAYGIGVWGLSLVRGWNLSGKEIWSPTAYYTGTWPPVTAGNCTVIPDGTAASLVSDSQTGGADSGTSSATGSGSGSATGSQIADTALQYKGHCYLYGGSAGTNGKGCWDCSSFVNWVLGHDLGMRIPGGTTYNGVGHGPNTLLYLGFGTAVPGGAAAAKAGDLCVWPTHMGIAIGGGQMISALNEHLGTLVTTIPDGAPGGEPLTVRRVA